LVRGRLNVTYENAREAYVTANGVKYFVDENRRHFNRAFHYDVVALEPLPESQWGRPVGKRRLVHHRDDDTDDNNLSLDDISAPTVPSARVVGIVESSHRVYVATMVDVPSNDESAVLVVPMDIRIPKIRVHTKSWRRFVEQRLLVEIDAWDVTSNYPAGRCLELLGPIADLETEVSALLHENHVALDPFSVAALACLPPAGDAWTIPEEEIQGRRDLRQSRKIFSVDPPGCQDIDDAMHTTVLPNADIEVGVSCAYTCCWCLYRLSRHAFSRCLLYDTDRSILPMSHTL
jgi:exoribonuclease R